MRKRIKVVQISDFHLNKNPKDRLFGLINADETFLDVIEKVRFEEPDFIIATGDLSQDGSIESYQRLKNYLSNLTCNVYLIYGNHDNPINLNSILVEGNVKLVPYLQTDYGTFLFCNSYKEGYDSGLLTKTELNQLENNLIQFNACILVIHHHFVPLNTLADDFILENSHEFLSIILKYKDKIKLCITGHVHNSYDVLYKGIPIRSSLSTCLQFAKTKTLLFDSKKPGYTLYTFTNSKYEVVEKTI